MTGLELCKQHRKDKTAPLWQIKIWEKFYSTIFEWEIQRFALSTEVDYRGRVWTCMNQGKFETVEIFTGTDDEALLKVFGKNLRRKQIIRT